MDEDITSHAKRTRPCRHENWSYHREYTPKHFPGTAIFEFLKCDNCHKQSALLHSYSPRPRYATAEEGAPDKWIRVKIERVDPYGAGTQQKKNTSTKEEEEELEVKVEKQTERLCVRK